MSEGMNADQITRVFESLGRIEQKIDGNASTLSQHILDDKAVAKALFERVEVLQLGQAKQKGFLTALTSVGSVLGAGVGYLVEKIMLGGGHH